MIYWCPLCWLYLLFYYVVYYFVYILDWIWSWTVSGTSSKSTDLNAVSVNGIDDINYIYKPAIPKMTQTPLIWMLNFDLWYVRCVNYSRVHVLHFFRVLPYASVTDVFLIADYFPKRTTKYEFESSVTKSNRAAF